MPWRAQQQDEESARCWLPAPLETPENNPIHWRVFSIPSVDNNEGSLDLLYPIADAYTSVSLSVSLSKTHQITHLLLIAAEDKSLGNRIHQTTKPLPASQPNQRME